MATAVSTRKILDDLTGEISWVGGFLVYAQRLKIPATGVRETWGWEGFALGKRRESEIQPIGPTKQACVRVCRQDAVRLGTRGEEENRWHRKLPFPLGSLGWFVRKSECVTPFSAERKSVNGGEVASRGRMIGGQQCSN